MAKKPSLPDHIRRWREKPSDMVRDLFQMEPDVWQAEVLDAFPKTPRVALLASKGVGKTFLLAVLIWNFLLTRTRPKIACISISGANLSDNLWSELALLRSKSPLLQELFEYTSKKIFSKQQGMENVWFCSARSWAANADRAQQASALSGLHADQILFVIDESGSMPESILASAENALSSCVEGHIVQAGNPEKLEGPLYRAYKSNMENGGDWLVVPINGDPDNPKRSPRVSIEWARSQIKEWGRENNYVKINIFGEFPSASLNALIGPEEVEEAMKRYWRPFDIGRAAKILGIDVARQGDDCFDEATQILTSEGWKFFRDLTGAERVLSMAEDKASWEPITKIHRYDFDGEMNLFENKSLNFCITDRHRLWVKTNPKSSLYKFEPFKDLPKEFVIREKTGWSGTNPAEVTFVSRTGMPYGGERVKTWRFTYEDWAAFLGWFVSEGNVYREKRGAGRLTIQIGQNPGAKQEEIKTLLTRMGIMWRVRSSGDAVTFTNGPIGEYLIAHCGVGAAQKRVPRDVKDSSEKCIRLFLDSFLKGDGTVRANGMGRAYITSSKILADDLHEMLAKLGRAGKLRLKEKAGSIFHIGARAAVRANDTYVVYERSCFSFGKTVRKKDVKRIRYTGQIWCISTPFQSIYVRRNGVPMWSGNSSVIAKRQGIQMLPFIKRRGLNSNEGAALVAREWDAWGANVAFIDATGGFGFGWIDQLNNLGKSPVGVQFAGSAHNKNRFLNKRAEMAWDLVEWIKAGGGLPECPELAAALIKTTYDHKNDLLYLEPKEMVKAKLGYSPDEFDAAILCFAEPISIGANSTRSPNRSAVDQNFDIFNPQQPGAGGGYDPFPAYNPIR